ncbi:MAG: HAD-IA family hydrolase [Acinetobacter sp.]|nr:HAD-IA family hydrolase [Acinetobacter sp.]
MQSFFTPRQCLLIDLDGTLTDPKIGITQSVRYALAKLQHPIADDVNIDWVIGPPLKASLAQLLNTQDDHLAEQALAAYRERFADVGLFENTPYPHVKQTLASLQQRSYRLFLATAKPTVYATRIMQHFEFAPYFTAMYGSELTGERTNKGDLIAYILQQEQLSADDCVMIGDREHDILGAKRHGIASIGVTYGYAQDDELQQAHADAYINAFNELLTLFSPAPSM